MSRLMQWLPFLSASHLFPCLLVWPDLFLRVLFLFKPNVEVVRKKVLAILTCLHNPSGSSENVVGGVDDELEEGWASAFVF